MRWSDPRPDGGPARPVPRPGRGAHGGRRRAALPAAAVLVLLLLTPAAVALAASPTPSGPAAGDPRSGGQGPGLVGDPGFAIAAVTAITLASVAITLLYVRATGGPAGR